MSVSRDFAFNEACRPMNVALNLSVALPGFTYLFQFASFRVRQAAHCSSGLCKHTHPLVGQGIGPFVAGITRVATHPAPLYLMFGHQRIQFLP